ncbi:MAG: 16S rRNA (cytidine(1402)-2'-O)-methyltransferase [Actinomycetota bacterium]|nr:16S rRNA (cytidine(1402)-2'-O)-methyltransferase [Actinomycetota bacterium]
MEIKENSGTLLVCGTPIGNLEDASFRLISTLKKADLIAAEDTRTARKLLDRYQIGKKKLLSYHDFSGQDKILAIAGYLEQGKDVALVTESGMPAIQDPGYKLIRHCLQQGLPVTVIPGPNAALAALVLSGFPTDSFLFVGFAPKTKVKRRNRLQQLKGLPFTLIFYESPHRTLDFLKDLYQVCGDRQVCIARELTKIYEQTIRGNLSQVISQLDQKLKGEIVIVAEGHSGDAIKEYSLEEIKQRLMDLMSEGLSKKSAMKIIRGQYDIDRQTLYNISTKI